MCNNEFVISIRSAARRGIMSTVMHLAFIYELLYIVQSLFQSVLFLRPTHGVVAYGTFNGDDGERETGKECSQCQGVIK